MAMNCCPKEYAEVCEILVCVDAPPPLNPGLYQRLRFGLLASPWLPSPLGICMWSALHVMLLIVGGPVLWVLCLLIVFLFYSVFLFGLLGIFAVGLHVVLGLIAVPVDVVLLFVPSIKFFLQFPPPLDNWCLTVFVWKDFEDVMRRMVWGFVPIGVPCMSGSWYEETKHRKFET